SISQPIPITAQEEEVAINEENIKKEELITIINLLLDSLDISNYLKY
ncbi:6906_t:CDS:1, partial [Scutellospora calospora]